MRLRLVGQTAFHAELVATTASVREEIEMLATGVGSDIWIEKIELRGVACSRPRNRSDGRRRFAPDGGRDDDRPLVCHHLEERIAEFKIKLPPEHNPNLGSRRSEKTRQNVRAI